MTYDDDWVEDSSNWVCPTCDHLNRSPLDNLDCTRCGNYFQFNQIDWQKNDERVFEKIEEMLSDSEEN